MKKYIFLILAIIYSKIASPMEMELRNQTTNTNKPRIEAIFYVPETVENSEINDRIHSSEDFDLINFYEYINTYNYQKLSNWEVIINLHAIFVESPKPDDSNEKINDYKKQIQDYINKQCKYEKNIIVLHFVRPTTTESYKETINDCDEKILINIKNLLLNNASNNISKDWIFYDFHLTKRPNFKTVIFELINLMKQENTDTIFYCKLAKLSNNKKLFRAIINLIYKFNLLKKIPVSHSNNQCSTLPEELSYEILCFMDVDSLAAKKIEILPKKRKICTIL